ncbi:hypothetical protein [Streptomyces sp. 891-h]|uniref:hypothetical protein n=1 Tax=Streptomyces sp. 891-h TaxID=2720714 RepID=UPI001FA97BF6|nr:hypothetical protein [Streptomyces sp. 891-h]UNZ15996.1 hypothetical protein HC362_01685 [Streptomyces sp. 891-h]
MTNGTADDDDGARGAATCAERPIGEYESAQRGIVRATFTVLRRNGRHLLRRTACVTGLAALGGLLVTTVAFLVAWPVFAQIRSDAAVARQMEDSFAPDGSLVDELWLIALAGLPFLILLLHLGCAALQTASAHAAAAEPGGDRRTQSGSRSIDRPRARFRAVLGVYLLRGVCVWVPLVAGVLVEQYFTTTMFREYTVIVPKWQYPNLFALLRYGPPTLGLLITLVLRFSWALAPAAAAVEGLSPFAALRRSWSLVWARSVGWLRAVAVTLPLGVLTVGMYVLLHLAARPLRSRTVSLFLEWGPDNTYAAYVAGLLAPIAVALLLAGALALPPAHTALTVLHQRLVQLRERTT